MTALSSLNFASDMLVGTPVDASPDPSAVYIPTSSDYDMAVDIGAMDSERNMSAAALDDVWKVDSVSGLGRSDSAIVEKDLSDVIFSDASGDIDSFDGDSDGGGDDGGGCGGCGGD